MASSIALDQPLEQTAPTGFAGSLLNRIRKAGQSLRNISREDATTIGLGIGAGVVTRVGLGMLTKAGVAAIAATSSTTIVGAALAAAVPIAAAMAVGATASLATSAVKHARAGRSFRSFWERDNLKKAGVAALISGGTMGWGSVIQDLTGESASELISTAFHKMTDGLSTKLFNALPLGEAHAQIPSTVTHVPAVPAAAASSPIPSTVTTVAEPSAAASAPAAKPIIPSTVTEAPAVKAAPIPSIVTTVVEQPAPAAAIPSTVTTTDAAPIPATVTTVAEQPAAATIPSTVTTDTPATPATVTNTDAVPAIAAPVEKSIIPSTVTTQNAAPTATADVTQPEAKIIPAAVTEAPTTAQPAVPSTAPSYGHPDVKLDKAGHIAYQDYGVGQHKTLDTSVRERALAWAKKMNPLKAFKAAAEPSVAPSVSPAIAPSAPVAAADALPKTITTAAAPVAPVTAVPADEVADALAKAKSVVTQDQLTNHFTLERLQQMAKAATGVDAPADATAESLAKQLRPDDADALLKDIQQQAPQLKAENVAAVCTTEIPKEKSAVNVIKTMCSKFKEHMGGNNIALVNNVNEPDPQKGLRLLYQKAVSAVGLNAAPQKTVDFITDNISGPNGVIREMAEAQPAL